MDLKKVEIFLFGASSGGKHVLDILLNLDIKVAGFIDNDCKKWETEFEQFPVYCPKILLKKKAEQKIIITSLYYDEIKSQLDELGIPKTEILLKEQIIEGILQLKGYHKQQGNKKQVSSNKLKTIVFDLSEGFQLSGAVKWTLNVIDSLQQFMCNVVIFSMLREEKPPYLKCDMKQIPFSFSNYYKSIQETVLEIEKLLPCTIILNQLAQVFWAACLVKQRYPKELKIISVVHSDFSKIYEQNVYLEKYIDCYICVSKEIAFTIGHSFHIPKEKIHYKQSSVEYDETFNKDYSKENQPLSIGYAARLEKAQKRADLLLFLIKRMEEKHLNYKLYIAGMGSFYKPLEKYINENQLSEKIYLYGIISYNKMNEFWKKKDIFINLSDVEGTSISMLEAMSWGVVPVVTNTSGVNETIQNGINGYIHQIGDIDGIYTSIEKLSKNRNILKKFGTQCRKQIYQNNMQIPYAKFILDLLH